jgi:hypothetical protein
MSVDVSLGVERLLTNVTHFCIGKLLLAFWLDAWHILYVGRYD